MSCVAEKHGGEKHRTKYSGRCLTCYPLGLSQTGSNGQSRQASKVNDSDTTVQELKILIRVQTKITKDKRKQCRAPGVVQFRSNFVHLDGFFRFEGNLINDCSIEKK